MKIRGSHKNQMASGASYLVKYDAELLQLGATGELTLEIMNVIPPDADGINLQMATEAIRRGAERSLEGRGAVLRIANLIIHDTDCNPYKFQQFTAQELQKVLPPKER
jgi:hypothetical protein